MDNKKLRYMFLSLIIVFAVVLIVMGIDIEMKIYKLSQGAPVEVYTAASTSAEYNETTAFIPPTTFATTTVHGTLTHRSSEAYTSEYSETTASAITSDKQTTVTAQAPLTEAEDTAPSEENEETTVIVVMGDTNFYVTKTGKKYHKADCSYLSDSKIKVTVEEIIEGGYEPCSRCMKE